MKVNIDPTVDGPVLTVSAENVTESKWLGKFVREAEDRRLVIYRASGGITWKDFMVICIKDDLPQPKPSAGTLWAVALLALLAGICLGCLVNLILGVL